MAPSSRSPKWPGDLDTDSRRLKSLTAQVAKAKARDEAAEKAAFDPAKPSTGMGLGLKMGMDLTVATLMGFALGALLDWPLGSFPLVALVLCGLGFAAGVRMVLAAANDYRRRLETSEIDGSDRSGFIAKDKASRD